MDIANPPGDGKCQARAVSICHNGSSSSYMLVRRLTSGKIMQEKYETPAFFHALRQLSDEGCFEFDPEHNIFVHGTLNAANAETWKKHYMGIYSTLTARSGFHGTDIDLAAMASA